jgi:hypothetical protein
MSPEVVAVDIDDVLFPGTQRLVADYAELHGVTIENAALLIEGQLKGTLAILKESTPDLSEEEVIDCVESLLTSSEYHAVEPLPGAIEGMSEISDSRKAVAVTSRPSVIASHTHEWINEFFPGIFADIRLLGARWGRGAVIDKFDTYNELGVTHVVDDLYRHAIHAAKIGAKAVLFGRYTWNDVDDETLPPHVTRCENWPAVVEYFDARS